MTSTASRTLREELSRETRSIEGMVVSVCYFERALVNLERALTKETFSRLDVGKLAGTDKTNLLQCMIWVKDIKNDYAGMNEVYNEWIKDAKPVRACVESNMVYKQEGVQLLVEIQAIAALPTQK